MLSTQLLTSMLFNFFRFHLLLVVLCTRALNNNCYRAWLSKIVGCGLSKNLNNGCDSSEKPANYVKDFM